MQRSCITTPLIFSEIEGLDSDTDNSNYWKLLTIVPQAMIKIFSKQILHGCGSRWDYLAYQSLEGTQPVD